MDHILIRFPNTTFRVRQPIIDTLWPADKDQPCILLQWGYCRIRIYTATASQFREMRYR